MLSRSERALQQVDAVRSRIDALRPFSAALLTRLQALVVPEFLWASGALGGRESLSLMETRAFLERSVVSGGHPLELFLELERHRAAYGLLEQRAREGGSLDVPFVRAVHQRLVSGARGAEDPRPGQWKKSESALTRRRGLTFEYAAPDDVPRLMDALLAGFAARREQEHPLLAATWLYFHFLLIHPFEGQNGHVARLLATATLISRGYPPLQLQPEELGEYLDALAACHHTAPRGECQPLSDKVDITPLLELFARALERTGRRILDVVEGRDLAAADLPGAVVESQQAGLEHLLANQDASWRVRAGIELRRLHEQVVDVARRVVVSGPLYRVVLREHGVLPTHQLVLTELGAKLPAGDAGIMGEVVLLIEPEPTAAGVVFPPVQRLQLLVAAVQLGTQVILHWSGDAEVEVHPGPPEAASWSRIELERLLVRSVDRRRRAFEMLVMDQNLGRSEVTSRIREQLRSRRATRPPLLRPGAEKAPPSPPPLQERPITRRLERRPRGEAGSLPGLAPVDPPVSF